VGDVDEGPLRREKRTQLEAPFPHPNRRVSLTAQQPEVNIARTAIEALAGVLGGTQSLTRTPWTSPGPAVGEGGANRAAHPAGDRARDHVTNVADPLGGSWFVESLTDEMAAQAKRSSPRSQHG